MSPWPGELKALERLYLKGNQFMSSPEEWETGGGLHSSTFQLNLCRVGHTSPCPLV